MSSFTLQNIATDIDSAISRVVSADTAPTTASQNMVTSGGVKAAIDAIGSGANGIITTDSFTSAALEESSEGLSSTDTAIPTSKTVKDYIDNSTALYKHMLPSDFLIGANLGHAGFEVGMNTFGAGFTIPEGFKATGLTAYGRRLTITARPARFNLSTGLNDYLAQTLGSANTTTNSLGSVVNLNFSSDFTGSSTEYLYIELERSVSSNAFFQGGFITLVRL
ncbi:hypothetical protein [Sneathiella sp.]|jgi:hypothetical protein|uniref:hypothetical protein n=1 Tax=Sneathiella sp. TaxID=1964365 RepID=UPI0025E57538|nr:hypothetical protein [Sneathiella sp.]|tara:strand:+ start:974 stop:1639 length:666 start_codon:yes stop_codon:yes gene_type:complete